MPPTFPSYCFSSTLRQPLRKLGQRIYEARLPSLSRIFRLFSSRLERGYASLCTKDPRNRDATVYFCRFFILAPSPRIEAISTPITSPSVRIIGDPSRTLRTFPSSFGRSSVQSGDGPTKTARFEGRGRRQRQWNGISVVVSPCPFGRFGQEHARDMCPPTRSSTCLLVRLSACLRLPVCLDPSNSSQ